MVIQNRRNRTGSSDGPDWVDVKAAPSQPGAYLDFSDTKGYN
jgi:hypothetical protein